MTPPSRRELRPTAAGGGRCATRGRRHDGPQGVPLISARRWDTGVSARWGGGVSPVSRDEGQPVQPLTDDDNGGKQMAAASASRRRRVTGRLGRAASSASRPVERDTARSAGCPSRRVPAPPTAGLRRGRRVGVRPRVVRGEVVASRWDMPFQRRANRSLGAWRGWLEGRVELSPRWAVAGRGERLVFSRVATPNGDDQHLGCAGDPPRGRHSYLVQRNVRLKGAWQYNWRDGGRVRREDTPRRRSSTGSDAPCSRPAARPSSDRPRSPRRAWASGRPVLGRARHRHDSRPR